MFENLNRPEVLAVVVATFASACTRPPAAGSGEAEALPSPPAAVALAVGGTVDRARVLEAGRRQSYDQNPGASDQDVLDGGAVAVVEPEPGAFRLTPVALDSGVVVARFRNLSEVPVKRLSLVPNGTTYWYLYSREGKLFSAYIVDSPDSTADRVDIPTIKHPVEHPPRPWRQSVAQWQLPGVLGQMEQGLGAGLADGSQPWITCTPEGCCKVAP